MAFTRDTNPLAPVYRLPSAHRHQPEPEPPRAVRNTLDVSDIEGTRSRPIKQNAVAVQNVTLDVSDIEGAQPGWRPPHK